MAISADRRADIPVQVNIFGKLQPCAKNVPPSRITCDPRNVNFTDTDSGRFYIHVVHQRNLPLPLHQTADVTPGP